MASRGNEQKFSGYFHILLLFIKICLFNSQFSIKALENIL